MPSITAILEVENNNTDRIHLFRESIFMKAYQRSAFLFVNNVKNYRPVKKHFKGVGSDIVMLGFPSNLLEKMVSPDRIQELGDGHVTISFEGQFSEKEYNAWFATIPLDPAKEKKQQPSSSGAPASEPSFSGPASEPVPSASASALSQSSQSLQSSSSQSEQPSASPETFTEAKVTQPPPTPPQASVETPPRMTVTVYEAERSVERVVERQAPAVAKFEKLLEQLEIFSVENSTPIECMMFVSRLKTELKRVRSGSL